MKTNTISISRDDLNHQRFQNYKGVDTKKTSSEQPLLILISAISQLVNAGTGEALK